jgi:hypothetical protein
MTLGGGNHGHVGIIMSPTDYNTLTEGTDFNNPVNSGFYPAGLAQSATMRGIKGDRGGGGGTSTTIARE